MTISIYAEKAFDKTYYHFVIKTLETSYRRNLSQHNKDHI